LVSTTGTEERSKPDGAAVAEDSGILGRGGGGKAATVAARPGGGAPEGAMAGPDEVPGRGVNLRPVCSAEECIVAPLV